MKILLLIACTFILQPLTAQQQKTQYMGRKGWLSKRYQDSIGISTILADSIISIEDAATKDYYKALSDYNKSKAQGLTTTTPPNLKEPFTQATKQIHGMLNQNQFVIWNRLQIGKYNDYTKPGFNIGYLRGEPQQVKEKIIAHVNVSSVIADSLLLFSQEYNKRLATLSTRSINMTEISAGVKRSINHLNEEARRVLNDTQYAAWIDWQNNKPVK